VHERRGRLRGERSAEAGGRDARLVLEVRVEQRLVVLRQQLDELRREGLVAVAMRKGCGAAAALADRGRHRDRRRRQRPPDFPHHPRAVGAAAVELVHEQERRDPQALQRPHQHPGLRLHALDGRDDEDDAVEDAQDTFHLGDEVRVAGRVDQVDRGVPDRE
jgi:hypothetical protein